MMQKSERYVVAIHDWLSNYRLLLRRWKEMRMKLHITVGVFLLVIGCSFAAQLDMAGLHEKAQSVFVDLDKQPNLRQNELWENEKISKILPISEIAKLILIKGMTSAPAELDSINILRILNSDTTFQKQTESTMPQTHTTYEAILVMKNGSCFLLRVAGNSGSITSEAGHGYFRVKYAPSNKELEAAH
jgi:hypothetical protein